MWKIERDSTPTIRDTPLMNTRSFLKSMVVLTAIFGLHTILVHPAFPAQDSGKAQYYELRVYTTKSEQQQKTGQ